LTAPDLRPSSVAGWLRGFRSLDIYATAIGLIVAVGVVLRAYHLGKQSLWIDELGEATTAKAPLITPFLNGVRSDFGAAPLDYLGVKLFTSVLGHGTAATRSWAFVMGCAAVFVIYLLGSRLSGDRMVGLIGAFMLAFSAFHIYYSEEARFYALAVVVGTLNLYVFLRALDSGAVKDWILYAALTVIALYSHFFLAILLPIEGLYLAGVQVVLSMRSGPNRRIKAGLTQVALCLGAQLVAVLAVTPWLVLELPSQINAGYATLPTLGIARIHQIFVVLIGLAPLNSVPPAGIGQTLRTDVVLMLALVGLVWSLALRRMGVLLLAGIVVFAIPLAWRSDQLGHYFWSERQVIFVLAPLYLLAAIGARHLLAAAGDLAGFASQRGWFDLSKTGWRDRSVGLAAGLALGLAPAWVAAYWTPVQLVYSDRWLNKEDWRGVTAFIDKQGCSDTQYWTFLDAHYSYGIAYYDPSLKSRSHFLYALPDGSYDTSPIDDVARQNLGPHDWLVLDTGTASSLASGDTPDAVLRRQGWSATSFSGLMVYHQQICDGTSTGD